MCQNTPYKPYYLLAGYLSTQLDTRTTVHNTCKTAQDKGMDEPFVRVKTTHGNLDVDFEEFYESSSHVISRVEIPVGDCIDVYLEKR